MGKCKRRILNNRQNDETLSYFSTRQEAVLNVLKLINDTNKKNIKKKSKKQNDFSDAIATISLFGITAEELSEAGVSYENLKALGNIID